MPNHPMNNPLAFNGVWDAVVVGAGFFGCSIAITLKEEYGLDNVLVIERESDLMTRASYGNQARIHNGYHYPRSFTTAFRSRVNFPRFVEQYGDCVASDFTSLYCVGTQNSLVTKNQFEKFCGDIGAECRSAGDEYDGLFNPSLIDAVYKVTEYAFDATKLARKMRQDMEAAGVSLQFEADVQNVASTGRELMVTLVAKDGTHKIRSRRVFNCTYAGLNSLYSGNQAARARLKYEIAEIALVTVPEPLSRLGITIMDGPFFSCMPFPATGQHSLTHVRYTPHFAWLDQDEARHPYEILKEKAPQTRARYMIGDAARYMPIMRALRHERSIFEVKTVLLTNEIDDGRPILFHPHDDLNGMYSILGGKIDNIFDIKESMQKMLKDAAAA